MFNAAIAFQNARLYCNFAYLRPWACSQDGKSSGSASFHKAKKSLIGDTGIRCISRNARAWARPKRARG